MAHVVAQVKRVIYHFLVSFPTLIQRGPAKSIPVTANGLWGVTLSAGNGASISCPNEYFAILQGNMYSVPS
jgi:hypothetical protein